MKLKAKRIFSIIATISMMAVSLVGCGSEAPSTVQNPSSEEKKAEIVKDPVELIWYISINNTFPDEQKVFDELNKYLIEKINVKVKQIIYKGADYNEKVPVIVSSGQKYDICFTASWGNKFYPNVDKGAYADITELLPKYAKETMDSLPKIIWESAKVNGKIYGIPHYKELGMQGGIMINADLAKKINVDTSKIKTLEDLEPVLKTVKEKLPNVIPFTGAEFTLTVPYEPLAGDSYLPAASKIEGQDCFSDMTKEVFNQFESKDYMNYCKLMNKYFKAGYLPADPVTYGTDSAGRDRDDKANKLFAWTLGYAPGYKNTRAAEVGHAIDYIPLYNPAYCGSGALMAVSANSEHKEEAVKLLNLVNSDEYVGTLLRHGIKDVHYKEVENKGSDGKAVVQIDQYSTGFDAKTHPYNYTYGWHFGSVFNQKWATSYSPDIVKEFMDYNNSAKNSSHLGFVIDLTSLSTEQAALSNVVKEYNVPLMKGVVDPEKQIPVFLKKLKDNGSEKFITEIQAQVDKWKATKK